MRLTRTPLAALAGLATLASLTAMAACGSSGPKITGTAPTTPTATATQTPTTAPGTTGGTVAPVRQALPASCAGLDTKQLAADMGGIAGTHQLAATGTSLTCEFVNGNASGVSILTLGRNGSMAALNIARTHVAAGVKTTDISGVGVAAFTIGNGSKVTGLEALGADNLLVSLGANLPVDQLSSLVRLYLGEY